MGQIKMTEKLRIMTAELLGTFILIVIGCGSIVQSKVNQGGFTDVNLGFGLAAMLGILIAMPVSGGHINPAVTLGLALLGRVQKRAVPVYFLGQFVGAFLGAAVVFGVYYDAIVKIDPNL